MKSIILAITMLFLWLIGCQKEEMVIEPQQEDTCERIYSLYRTIEGAFVIIADRDDAYSNRDTLSITNNQYDKYIDRFVYSNDIICFE